MEKINGFTIIASQVHPRRHEERVILGARQTSDGSWIEYVTAVAEIGPVTSWHWGHYFGQPHGSDLEHLTLAAADMADRLV